jgi:hypothetical protein
MYIAGTITGTALDTIINKNFSQCLGYKIFYLRVRVIIAYSQGAVFQLYSGREQVQ